MHDLSRCRRSERVDPGRCPVTVLSVVPCAHACAKPSVGCHIPCDMLLKVITVLAPHRLLSVPGGSIAVQYRDCRLQAVGIVTCEIKYLIRAELTAQDVGMVDRKVSSMLSGSCDVARRIGISPARVIGRGEIKPLDGGLRARIVVRKAVIAAYRCNFLGCRLPVARQVDIGLCLARIGARRGLCLHEPADRGLGAPDIVKRGSGERLQAL